MAAVGIASLCVAVGGCSSSGTKTAVLRPAVGSTIAGTAHATIGDLELTGGYIPEPAAPDVAAAYLTVTNSGSAPDSIVKLSTNVTTDVMAMTEKNSGTVGTMTDLSKVTIPAHGSVRFTPDHAHLMLQNPDRHLKTGDRVGLTITFAHAGTVTLSIPVVPITGPSASASGSSSGAGGMAGMPGMG